MCHVLLVEDSKIQHHVVARCLRSLGEEVELVIAETLAEAKQCLSGGCIFDVIILDLGLPDSQGVNSYIELQAVCVDTPIVVCTADDTVDTALECIRRGAETVLIKPALQALGRIVSYAVERNKTKKQLEDTVRRKMAEVTCGYHRDLQRVKETLQETSEALGMKRNGGDSWVESDTIPTNCA